MSTLSDFLSDNPAVMKIVAAAFAIGVIAASNVSPRAAEVSGALQVSEPQQDLAAAKADESVRAALDEARSRFAEMEQRMGQDEAPAVRFAELRAMAEATQVSLLAALERVDALDEVIRERVLSSRPALKAWEASNVLADVDDALAKDDYADARKAFGRLKGVVETADEHTAFRL